MSSIMETFYERDVPGVTEVSLSVPAPIEYRVFADSEKHTLLNPAELTLSMLAEDGVSVAGKLRQLADWLDEQEVGGGVPRHLTGLEPMISRSEQ